MRDLTVNEKRRELLAKFQGARSLCTCGHTGDLGVGDLALLSDHEGVIGHGACTVEGCSCAKFTWAGYVPALEAALERVSEGQSDDRMGPKPRGAKATAERRLLMARGLLVGASTQLDEAFALVPVDDGAEAAIRDARKAVAAALEYIDRHSRCPPVVRRRA